MAQYHAFSIQIPWSHPYDLDQFRWASFVGEVLQNLVRKLPNSPYWSTYYGKTAEFKVVTDDIGCLASYFDELRAKGFEITSLNRTLEEDLGSPRFIGPNSNSNRTHRATLILQSLTAVCNLLLDSVRKRDDGYWEQEANGDCANNPIGNHFYSVTHLYHLVADAQTLVQPFVIPDGSLVVASYYDYENNLEAIGPHKIFPRMPIRP